MKRFTQITLILILCLALSLAGCRKEEEAVITPQWVTSYTALEVDTTTGSSYIALDVNQVGSGDIVDFKDEGTTVWQIADGGEISGTGGQTWTLGAAEKLLADADTTNHTGTAGVVDINVGTVTANVVGIDVGVTMDNGTTGGVDSFGQKITLTQNDADGDLFGLKIEGAATANAAAGSYEYLASLVCSENSAGACTDALLITGGATNTSITDGVDVSDGEIAYAVNIGLNPILGYNADELTLGATDHHLIVTADEAAAVTFMGADNSTPADTIFDSHGAGTVQLGSADITSAKVRGIAFDADMTGAFNIDADLASYWKTAAGDITLEAEVASVTLKGDEGAVDAVHLDADETAGGGVTIAANTGGVDVNLTAAGPFAIDGDMLIVGNAGSDGDVADADNDMLVVGVLEVDGELEVDGTLDADSTSDFADTATFSKGSGNAILISAGGTISLPATSDISAYGYVNVGDGTPDGSVTAGTDEQFYVEGASEFDGEAEFDGAIDADSTSDFADTATFSKGSGMAVVVSSGGTLDVNSDIDLDGTGFDADVSSAISLDAGATSNFNTSAGDVNLEAETGSVWIKADEEVADAIHLDANNSITQGIDIDVGSVYGLSIDGGLTDFGSGTYSQAAGDGDVGIQDALEVNGVAYLDGGAEINGTLTLENDETIVNSVNGVITTTVDASGWFAVSTGNLVVGTPGSASLSLNGNDGYFEGTLEADGLARLDGGATLGAGDLTISNGSFFPDFTDAVVSDGDTITPTAYMRSISCSGAITFTLAASCTDGQPLVIYIDDAQNVVIMATNSKTVGGSNITVDQYDTVGYICEDNTWIMMYESNNS